MILKPMNVGEILGNSFTLFKEQFKSYMAIVVLSLVFFLAAGIFQGMIYEFIGKTAAAISAFAVVVLIVAVSFAMTGGLIKMASDQIADHEVNAMEAYRFGFDKVGSMFFAALIGSLASIAGLILLVIPGVYIGILFALFSQVIIIEGKGPWDALMRSKDLITGSWWRFFGIVLLIGILVSILANISAMLLGLIVTGIFGAGFMADMVSSLGIAAISFVCLPFEIIAHTLLYYDLRIRKENLDTELTVDELTEQSGSNLPG